ncbi:MAG: FeoA family protein [Bacteroidota bacterium]|nr:FeoA family protein [Bacteroidota bacterium]
MPLLTLNQLQTGQVGIVEQLLTSDPKLKMRLLELGVLKDTKIEIVRFAPLGDPIEIKIRGYRLSIRKEEAESVLVSQLK